MRSRTLFIAAAIATALAVGGCSAGGLPSGASNAAGSGSAAPTKTFAGTDLIAILKAVKPKVGSTAQIVGLAASKSYVKADVSGPTADTITENLTANGGKFAPKSCAPTLNLLGIVGEKKIAETGWQGAALSVGSNDDISIASAPSAADASGLVAETAKLVKELGTNCPNMRIVGGPAPSRFLEVPVSAKSDGSATFAYQEIQKYSNGTTTGETLETSYGNLFIVVISRKPSEARLESEVNAVIAAANDH